MVFEVIAGSSQLLVAINGRCRSRMTIDDPRQDVLETCKRLDVVELEVAAGRRAAAVRLAGAASKSLGCILSFSERHRPGIRQSIPRAGSSHAMPRSHAGA
jgi:hypothetical protein